MRARGPHLRVYVECRTFGRTRERKRECEREREGEGERARAYLLCVDFNDLLQHANPALTDELCAVVLPASVAGCDREEKGGEVVLDHVAKVLVLLHRRDRHRHRRVLGHTAALLWSAGEVGRGEGSVSNFPKHKPHCVGTLESGSGRRMTQRRGAASMAHLPSCRPSSSSFPPFGLRLPH